MIRLFFVTGLILMNLNVTFAQERFFPHCPNVSSNLKYGVSDKKSRPPGQVSELQSFLADYFNVDRRAVVYGYFGLDTKAYVMNFQQEQSLVVTGIVGKITRDKMMQVCRSGVEREVSLPTPTSDTQVLQTTPVPWGQKVISTTSIRPPIGKVMFSYFDIKNNTPYGRTQILDEIVFNYPSAKFPYSGKYDPERPNAGPVVGAYFYLQKSYVSQTSEQFDFSNPQWDNAKLYIDGVFVHEYGKNSGNSNIGQEYTHAMSPGLHTIELEYEIVWHAGDFALRIGADVLNGYQLVASQNRGYVKSYRLKEYSSVNGIKDVSLPSFYVPTQVVLSSYSPTSWRFQPGTNFSNIDSVLIESFEGGSEVRGLPEGIPVYKQRGVYNNGSQ